MLFRLSFLVTASIAAYAVRQAKGPRPSQIKPSDDGKENPRHNWNEERHTEQDPDADVTERKGDGKEEEEEEVKRISNIRPANDTAHVKDEEELLPEFENLLSGEIEFPLLSDKFDVKDKSQYDIDMEASASELARLRSLVKEFEEREVNLGGELLEYYGLKEQEYNIAELQKQLKIKTVEMNMLNITINSLQAERKKLQEEVAQGVSAKKELDVARNKIKELQRQIQLDASQTKGQLLLLKQQVTGLQVKEEEASKKDAEVEKRLKALKELEVEVVELRRKNKELLYEKGT